MKNILFVVPSLRRAGAETQVVDLVNHIGHKRFNIHLLSFSPVQEQLDRIDQSQVTYHHVLRNHKFHLGFIAGIAKVIKEQEIDLIHCTLQFSLLVAWFASLIALRKPVLIAVVHTTVNRGLKEDLHDILIYQWLMRLCKKIVFVCNNQRDYWEDKYPFIKSKSAVIYNGVDEIFFDPEVWEKAGGKLREELKIPEAACVVACIAGFRKEKGHNLLIEAISRADEDIYLILAGDGEMRESIEVLVKEKSLDDNVFFLGMMDDVRPVLAAVDATVLASTAVETFSIAMLESMSMATPMLATDIGGMAEAIDDGKTGWLIQPGDVDQLSLVISSIASDRCNAKKIGQKARKKVVSNFSLESMAQQTEAIFDELLGGDN